jgi:hypothetical protein
VVVHIDLVSETESERPELKEVLEASLVAHAETASLVLGTTVDNAVPDSVTSFTETLHEDGHLKEEDENRHSQLVHDESIILLESPQRAAVHHEIEADSHYEEEHLEH